MTQHGLNSMEAQCVDAFAPYDGSIEATWVHDTDKNTVKLNGQGSYLGIKKVANGVELADATGAPSSRTYDILSLTENVLSLRIAVDNTAGLDGENAYWYFILAKVGSEEAIIPQTDADGDGVLDINDECPEEAGTLDTGCNPEGEVRNTNRCASCTYCGSKQMYFLSLVMHIQIWQDPISIQTGVKERMLR